MELLIENKGHTVQVQHATDYVCCHKCRGSGEKWETLYYDVFLSSPLYWLGVKCHCPSCGGRGYWKHNQLDTTVHKG